MLDYRTGEERGSLCVQQRFPILKKYLQKLNCLLFCSKLTHMHFESYHQPDVVWHLPRCSSRKEQLEASSRAAWLQNCTEVFTFTEHLEPHTASDGTLYSSLVFWIRSAFRTVFSLHLLSLFCSHEQDYNASIWLSLASKAPSYFCTIFLVSPISCTCGQL